MKHPLAAMMIASASFCGFTSASAQKAEPAATVTAAQSFKYTDEQFADIQMLRYKVEGFEQLTLKQKTFIYYLSEAALWGRDILFDQNGRYNLRIRQTLEALYTDYDGDRGSDFFRALSTYLKRVWFSSGIHHHYGCEKFEPGFSAADFRAALHRVPAAKLPLASGQSVDQLADELEPVIFDPKVMAMRVNQKDGEDLILTSACNYYAPGITQAEAEQFYAERKPAADPRPVMMGMNSRVERDEFGQLTERVWRVGGLYGEALEHIVENLLKARPFADSPEQQKVIDLLVEVYRTGDLRTFDEYAIHWLRDTESLVDFVCYFTESYGDPLGMKASWEAIVNFKDLVATERTRKLAADAQWFEDHSPVAPQFKKEKVKGVSAKVITAAILGGDLYPSTAIGINLPNSDWVRREHGSKSVTIGNLTDAYNKAAHGNGMDREFVIDDATRKLIETYGDACDDLHTDLHECLGHGSGKLLPGTDPDTLKAYGSTIEEAHMRNRAIIARWAYEHGKDRKVVELVKKKGKTYVKINDYEALRNLFGQLLAEVQRIKSEGDYEAARRLVEDYGVKIDPELHREVLARYERLHLSPYKGFINPVYRAERAADGTITGVTLDYTEPYDQQMLRYSRDYSALTR